MPTSTTSVVKLKEKKDHLKERIKTKASERNELVKKLKILQKKK